MDLGLFIVKYRIFYMFSIFPVRILVFLGEALTG